jgi:hypothetical protein
LAFEKGWGGGGGDLTTRCEEEAEAFRFKCVRFDTQRTPLLLPLPLLQEEAAALSSLERRKEGEAVCPRLGPPARRPLVAIHSLYFAKPFSSSSLMTPRTAHRQTDGPLVGSSRLSLPASPARGGACCCCYRPSRPSASIGGCSPPCARHHALTPPPDPSNNPPHNPTGRKETRIVDARASKEPRRLPP